jgi:uncharacterized ParB-like nuclease family protein
MCRNRRIQNINPLDILRLNARVYRYVYNIGTCERINASLENHLNKVISFEFSLLTKVRSKVRRL